MRKGRTAWATLIALTCWGAAQTNRDTKRAGKSSVEGLVRDISCPMQNQKRTRRLST
jgi:hypothetical protein